MRKRVEALDRIDASDRLAARHRSTRDCAERRTAMRALQLVQCFRAVLQPLKGFLRRSRGDAWRGNFAGGYDCALHGIRAQPRCAHVVRPSVQRGEFGFLARRLGEARRVLQCMQGIREAPLLVFRLRWPACNTSAASGTDTSSLPDRTASLRLAALRQE